MKIEIDILIDSMNQIKTALKYLDGRENDTSSVQKYRLETEVLRAYLPYLKKVIRRNIAQKNFCYKNNTSRPNE